MLSTLPLLFGAFLGIYFVALAVALAARRKHNREGQFELSWPDLLSSVARVLFNGLNFAVGDFRSASVGADGALFSCTLALLVMRKNNA